MSAPTNPTTNHVDKAIPWRISQNRQQSLRAKQQEIKQTQADIAAKEKPVSQEEAARIHREGIRAGTRQGCRTVADPRGRGGIDGLFDGLLCLVVGHYASSPDMQEQFRQKELATLKAQEAKLQGEYNRLHRENHLCSVLEAKTDIDPKDAQDLQGLMLSRLCAVNEQLRQNLPRNLSLNLASTPIVLLGGILLEMQISEARQLLGKPELSVVEKRQHFYGVSQQLFGLYVIEQSCDSKTAAPAASSEQKTESLFYTCAQKLGVSPAIAGFENADSPIDEKSLASSYCKTILEKVDQRFLNILSHTSLCREQRDTISWYWERLRNIDRDREEIIPERLLILHKTAALLESYIQYKTAPTNNVATCQIALQAEIAAYRDLRVHVRGRGNFGVQMMCIMFMLSGMVTVVAGALVCAISTGVTSATIGLWAGGGGGAVLFRGCLRKAAARPNHFLAVRQVDNVLAQDTSIGLSR